MSILSESSQLEYWENLAKENQVELDKAKTSLMSLKTPTLHFRN
jgi:hypothetical protein